MKIINKFLTWLFNFFPSYAFYGLIIAVLVLLFSWIFNINKPLVVGLVVFFSLMALVVIFVLGRQFWWFISGSGDYKERNGLLKRLWNKIF